ncbi:MAG TPA: hypothetical protein VLF79_01265 [Candidatus Saccharimonadales bacterium]|nr:hypothetical protein [Candidatus Saccharimonadales bacterium]
MTLLYALFFGAGVAAVAYSRLGRRVGYGNTQNVTIIVVVIFVITTIIFYTILATFIKPR